MGCAKWTFFLLRSKCFTTYSSNFFSLRKAGKRSQICVWCLIVGLHQFIFIFFYHVHLSCPYGHPILVNLFSKGLFEGIPSNFAQLSTWINRWTGTSKKKKNRYNYPIEVSDFFISFWWPKVKRQGHSHLTIIWSSWPDVEANLPLCSCCFRNILREFLQSCHKLSFGIKDELIRF